MNCKPGDLAIIVRSTFDKSHLGKIVEVVRWVELLNGAGWVVEPPLVTSGCTWGAVSDRSLRPIRDPGDDAVDEMLRPLPEVVGETGAVW